MNPHISISLSISGGRQTSGAGAVRSTTTTPLNHAHPPSADRATTTTIRWW
ncbi:hypothetical protein Hanom_Chr02g00151711 [Helianthus anomalus]